ncbi:MAG: acyl carrier protein [Caldilineaceae bacterium]
MMSTTDILLQFISDDLLMGLHGDELTAETELLLSELVDSLGIIRLMLFIEEEFQVAVPPEDVTVQHFRSVSVMVDYLSARVGNAQTLEAAG